jgi:glycosyltransferase involved in cell wall biosynthesis
VTRWISVSRFVAGVLGGAGVRSEVIPNPTEIGPPPAPFEARSDVVYVGALSREKGIDDVVAFAREHARIGVRVAGDGPERQTVLAAARALPNLTYLGMLPRAQVRSLLAEARVALMPSRWEDPGPLVALEAMAAGVPVVAYRHGGLCEYVSDSGGGVIVGSQPELSAVAASLHGDASAWQELSTAARHGVETVHSPGRYLEALEHVYESAVR